MNSIEHYKNRISLTYSLYKLNKNLSLASKFYNFVCISPQNKIFITHHPPLLHYIGDDIYSRNVRRYKIKKDEN